MFQLQDLVTLNWIKSFGDLLERDDVSIFGFFIFRRADSLSRQQIDAS